MSILQSHFENRRRYLFDRLKQPGYEERSIKMIQKSQKEIEANLKEMADLLAFDHQEKPCLPLIAIQQVKELYTDEDYQDFAAITAEQLQKLNQEDRAEVLEYTLQLINEVKDMHRTIFIMMYQNKQDTLMEFCEQYPETKTTLHYDENDRDGFNKGIYQERSQSLKNDIRVVAFKKFCSNEEGPGDDIATFKQRFETVVIPKVQEIVSLIDPCLTELEIFMRPVIQYGLNKIDIENMIRSLDENLSLLHELSKTKYCPTLELTIQEYQFLVSLNHSKSTKEMGVSK